MDHNFISLQNQTVTRQKKLGVFDNLLSEFKIDTIACSISQAFLKPKYNWRRVTLLLSHKIYILIASFMHQILEITDPKYQQYRSAFSSRKKYWNQLLLQSRSSCVQKTNSQRESLKVPSMHKLFAEQKIQCYFSKTFITVAIFSSGTLTLPLILIYFPIN